MSTLNPTKPGKFLGTSRQAKTLRRIEKSLHPSRILNEPPTKGNVATSKVVEKETFAMNKAQSSDKSNHHPSLINCIYHLK